MNKNSLRLYPPPTLSSFRKREEKNLYLLLHFWTPDLEGGQTENTCCIESLGKKVRDVHLVIVRDCSLRWMLQALQGLEAFGLPLKPVAGTWAS